MKPNNSSADQEVSRVFETRRLVIVVITARRLHYHEPAESNPRSPILFL
jgi:hypothetical protein